MSKQQSKEESDQSGVEYLSSLTAKITPYALFRLFFLLGNHEVIGGDEPQFCVVK